MRYWECILDTPSGDIDSRCEELSALGVGGFVVENEEDFRDFLENNRQYWDYVDRELEQQYAGLSRLKFYLTDDEEGFAVLRAVQSRYPGLELRTVEDSDWENNWREYYQPIDVGERLVVVPEWEEPPAGGRLPLRLDPGLTFGTGSHATTRMCLQQLETCAGSGKRVLDLGCGSGILGIGALVLGAERCVGCDIDPKAPDVAMANAALNGIGAERFQVYAGDILSDRGLRKELGTGYGLVLANIVSDVILPLSGFVRDFMAEGAHFICSGIIEGRQDEVRAALERNGFTVEEHFCEEEWHCFLCR
ncbi:MAG: 50S ribosomal protein L11 methyltransferase [Oscillospiraceae bacterium]|nr:50S ribosomal protein L11 methyltransferase [Oscillospiraceae bacterium]